jgi:3-oxoacyl-[acyl-carrier-protein] synthase-3
MSCLVQRQIGASNAFAIDVNAACTGFVNALDIARNYLATKSAKKILIVSGEMLSNHVDFTDRATCILFGDGAGAVVVESSDKLYHSHLGAMGEDFADLALYCKVPYKSNNPFGEAAALAESSTPQGNGFISMDGKAVYKFATDIMPKAVKAVCEPADSAPSEHPYNKRSNEKSRHCSGKSLY